MNKNLGKGKPSAIKGAITQAQPQSGTVKDIKGAVAMCGVGKKGGGKIKGALT